MLMTPGLTRDCVLPHARARARRLAGVGDEKLAAAGLNAAEFDAVGGHAAEQFARRRAALY